MYNVQYGPANELLHWSYGAYFTETFHYNSLLQLTEQSLVSAGYNAYDEGGPSLVESL